MPRRLFLCALLLVCAPSLAAPCRLSSASQRTALERYRALLDTCGEREATALAAELIRFPTVSSELPASTHPAFARMESFLQRWAAEHGLSFRSVGAREVFELSWGDARPAPDRPKLGYLLHGDVVPAKGSGWTHAPFTPVVRAGRLHGRGAEDDKGPIASALVAVALAKRAGLTPRGRVLIIIGNGEEHDWAGMKSYANTQPHPEHIISVDSGFPLVFAEAGFVAWSLEAPVGDTTLPPPGEDAAVAVEVQAGAFLTEVPRQASMTLAARRPEVLCAQVRDVMRSLRQDRPTLRATVRRRGAHVLVETTGRSVHASAAPEGHNALWDLAAIAQRLPLVPNGITAVLDVVARKLDGDFWGDRLGIGYEHDRMGKLLVTANVLGVQSGKVRLDINMRRPDGVDHAAFEARLSQVAATLQEESSGQVQEGSGRYVGDPAVADVDGPMATTLLRLYRELRADPDAAPISSRGGTYARLFPGAVNFGPSLPGEPYSGHTPDESIPLERLRFLTHILGEALIRLDVVDEGP